LKRINAVFGYSRVSGSDQLKGGGLNRQRVVIARYCQDRNLEVKRIFEEEGVSGTLSERPAFASMLADCELENVKIIVVEDLSRLARELMVQMNLATLIASKGIELFSANTGENISEALQSDPMRRAMIQMQGVFAELERAVIVKRLENGIKQIEDSGLRNGVPVKRRTLDGKVKVRGRLRITERYPELIPIVADLRDEGNSLNGIAKVLNRKGYKSDTGGQINHVNIARILIYQR